MKSIRKVFDRINKINLIPARKAFPAFQKSNSNPVILSNFSNNTLKLGFFAVMAASLFLFCGGNPTVAGSGTQTETAKIRGQLVETGGTPAAGAQVYLRSSDYLPDAFAKLSARNDFRTMAVTTTDMSGNFSFDSITAGSYMLECLEPEGNVGAQIEVVLTGTDTVTEVATDTLKPLGGIAGKIQLPESLDASAVRVFVYGLDRITIPDSSGAFVIPNLPEGSYDLHFSGLDLSLDLRGNRGASVTSGQTTNLDSSHLVLSEHGLVAYWSFDENSGQMVYDASGHGNTGILGGSASADSADPVWVAGKLGAGLQFDSLNDTRVIVDAATSSLDSLTSFTYVTWINPISYGESYSRILSRETNRDSLDEFYICTGGPYYKDVGASITDIYDSTYESNSDSNTLALNEWQHLAVTYEDAGDKTIHVYINGIETAYRNHEAVTAQLRLSSNPLVIGNCFAGGRGFQGRIDEVKAYNRALSQSEILAEMNRQ